MILYSLLPLYKKERINYNAQIEQNKIGYKKTLSDLRKKREIALQECHSWREKREVKLFFKKQLKELEMVFKDKRLQAKIDFMEAVSKNKELKENVKLTKKSKSNLHQILYSFSRLPYEEKKNSLVVQELSPAREAKFSIKKRVFEDLSAFSDKSDDRIYASEKDIFFTTINLSSGIEKIPLVLRYSGQCVPVFLEKVRDDTYDKFSTENEHHIMLYSARIRETKAPKNSLKIGKVGGMIIIMVVLMIAYFGYKYSQGGL